jgi:hypothetical protein
VAIISGFGFLVIPGVLLVYGCGWLVIWRKGRIQDTGIATAIPLVFIFCVFWYKNVRSSSEDEKVEDEME